MNPASQTYKDFAAFYDLYVSTFDSDFEFYKSYCNASDSIVEIGCGTGRILDFLICSGCTVTGIDISQDMLDKASQKLQKWLLSGDLSLLKHDFTYQKTKKQFDIALLTFFTFNYILDKPVDFLQHIHESLTDEGALLIDVFYPKVLFDKSIEDKWISKKRLIEGMSIEIHDKRKMFGNIEYRQQIFFIDGCEKTINTKRVYYPPVRIKELLQLAGFFSVKFAYGYDFKRFADMIDEKLLENNYIVMAIK
jgi:SAM-dependent methyltransferase